MATVHIPIPMRDLTRGESDVVVEGGSLRRVIAEIEGKYPGFHDRCVTGSYLTPGLAVSIDGEMSTLGLYAKVGPDSEVHFVPAIGGGV
jgi:molybdopterin synthase sulfur carrier subunit